MELFLPLTRALTRDLWMLQWLLVTTALVTEVQAFTPEPNAAFKGKNSSLNVLQKHRDVGASKLMLPNSLYHEHQVPNVNLKRTRRQADNQATVRSIHPNFAPAQGTYIFLKGENFGGPNVTVTVGSLPCSCVSNITKMLPYSESPEPACNTDNQIACLVVNGSDWIGQALTVKVTTADGSEAVIDGNITFTFRDNPVILSVWPRTQYIAGGRRVNVTGENLDSGFQATLFLTTYRDENTIKYNRGASNFYSEPCTIHSSTVMECITRQADVPRRYRTERKKRQANGGIDTAYYLNDLELTVRINIQIGYTYVKDLFEVLDERGIMYIAKNPEFSDFPDSVFNLRLYEEENPRVFIEGRGFTLAAEKEDYNVTVGGVPCVVTKLFFNSIHCTPPKEEDIPPDGLRNNDGDPRVIVKVGSAGGYNPGVVRYMRRKPLWSFFQVPSKASSYISKITILTSFSVSYCTLFLMYFPFW